MNSSPSDCVFSQHADTVAADVSGGTRAVIKCLAAGSIGVIVDHRAKRGNVIIDRTDRRRNQRSQAGVVVAAFVIAYGLSLSPAAVSEETASTPGSATPGDNAASAENNIPFAGNIEIKTRLDAPGKLMIAGEQMHASLLRRFYVAHGYQTVWDVHSAEARRLQQVVLQAADHGLDASLFHGAALGEHGPTLSLVDRDLLLSDAFLSYADALSRGALPIEDRVDDEDLVPEPVDIVATIDAAIAAPDPGAVIEALAPTSADYLEMRRAYAEYRAAATEPPAARGKLGRASPETAAAAERRARQLMVNLERLRWLPRHMPRDRVVVNAAIARLQLFRDDRPIFTTRVVVGEVDKQTPEFQSTIDDILLNPPWNIPRSIAQKEILPKLAADPGYLASHHMRFRSNGSIQQEAGPYSALGRLKFEMTDRYDVYLHDTPTKSLFLAAARMMSHGCVRVENPRTLAMLLLGQPVEVIDKGIASGRTARRALPTPMPVFIVYQTAYVESDGSIQFRADPYDRDDEIWRYLTRAHQPPMAQDSSAGQRKG
jgi:murein L,D-transpeptidase YcbB/YkuD